MEENRSRVVTPEEAQETLRWSAGMPGQKVVSYDSLAHTVSTEPDRIRAAVVKALRISACWSAKSLVNDWADAIEDGADW